MKIVIILLILVNFSYADFNQNKINEVLSGLASNNPLKFYSENSNIKLSKSIKSPSKRDAQILITDASNLNKAIIVSSYKALKTNEKSIGAIYSRKGRTQIVFIKERLDKYGIVLVKKLRKHLVTLEQLNP